MLIGELERKHIGKNRIIQLFPIYGAHPFVLGGKTNFKGMDLFPCSGKITGCYIIGELWRKSHICLMYFKIYLVHNQGVKFSEIVLIAWKLFLECSKVTSQRNVLESYGQIKYKNGRKKLCICYKIKSQTPFARQSNKSTPKLIMVDFIWIYPNRR